MGQAKANMIEEVMTLAFDRASQTQTLWSLYITVVLGILAYIAATASTRGSALERHPCA